MKRLKACLLTFISLSVIALACYVLISGRDVAELDGSILKANKVSLKRKVSGIADMKPRIEKRKDVPVKKKATIGVSDKLIEDLDPLSDNQKGVIALMMKGPIEAAEELYHMESDDSAALLLRMFTDNDSDVDQRDAIIKTAMLLGNQSMKQLLHAGLEDKKERIRCSALRAWIATGLTDDKFSNKIKDMLTNDESQKARQVAAEYFYKRPEVASSGLEELHKALNESQRWTAWMAASALAFTKTTNPDVKNTMTRLNLKYKDSTDPKQRALAAAAAGYLATTGDLSYKESLLKYLADDNEKVRAGAVLGMPAFKEDVQMMGDFANIIEKEKSKYVFYALSQIATDIKIPKIEQACANRLDFISKDPRDASSRLHAALALAAFGRQRDGFTVVFEQMNQSHINPVFYKIAHTELRRASGKNFSYSPFTTIPEQQEWEVYINSLDN